MYVQYDTRKVHPLDRYEHYRAGAANERAPVMIDGGPLPDMLAVLSMIQVGDFTIELVTTSAAEPDAGIDGVARPRCAYGRSTTCECVGCGSGERSGVPVDNR
jgi:hypothetical protein